jgi:hypothetical protein
METQMKTIKLSKGYHAQISDEDFERVSQYKWSALVSKDKYTVYGRRNIIKENGKRTSLLLHRFILKIEDPSVEVDHKDNDGLNCQRHNLRKCTQSQNQHNRKTRDRNTSGAKGVDKQNGKWRARIGIEGKSVNLGLFSTLEKASKAYDEAALLLHKEFSNINALGAANAG